MTQENGTAFEFKGREYRAVLNESRTSVTVVLPPAQEGEPTITSTEVFKMQNVEFHGFIAAINRVLPDGLALSSILGLNNLSLDQPDMSFTLETVTPDLTKKEVQQ